MRFASYRLKDDPSRLAVEIDGSYYDLRELDSSLPRDMVALLERYESLSPSLRVACQSVKEQLVPLSSVRLQPPVSHPDKLLCLGLNYFDHAAEIAAKPPKYPDVFAKFSNTLIGESGEVVMPAQSEQLDHEIELAVIIGRECRNIKRDEALAFVGGYTIFNDISVRDIQLRSSQATMGKNFDSHGPCGPVVVTPDEIPDPQQLRLRLRVNGEVRQQSRTDQMIFPVAELIEFVSSVMTLVPGDIISTGTPAGTGIAKKPPVWLKRGDRVQAEIEQIGVLSNTIV